MTAQQQESQLGGERRAGAGIGRHVEGHTEARVGEGSKEVQPSAIQLCLHGLWNICREISPSLNGHLDRACHSDTDQDLHIQFHHGPVSSRGYNESCHFWEQKREGDPQSRLSTLLHELVSSEASS